MAQTFQLGPTGGGDPRLETLLSELEIARRFTVSIVRGLTADELAAKPQETRNSIGAILSHLAAAERLMQRITSLGQPFPAGTEDDRRVFAFEVEPLAGNALSAYLAHLEETRARTRALFAEHDDAWLEEPRTFFGNPANYHYYWLHLLMDEARHQGQIILMRKYLMPTADPGFDPYAGLAADAD